MDYDSIDFSYDTMESKLLNNAEQGIEIDYDPEFIELENMIAIKMDQQYGNTIIPAAPIDWSRALSKAYELLDKSKDYRLCCIITRALTHKHGIRGTLKGIETIYLLTANCWRYAFPAIVFDGETDFLPRSNAIAELNSMTGLVGDLRHTDIRLGSTIKLSINRMEKILSGRSENEEFSRDQLLQICRDDALSPESEIFVISRLLSKISELEKLLSQYLASEQKPDFSQLKSMLTNISVMTGEKQIAEIDGTGDFTEASTSHIYSKTQITPTFIQTRDDAINALDIVCEFLKRNDPANPAPMLINRARNMIGQDFYTILSQLAPDAVAQAEHITGPQF
ncbi:ImpA family type VI secretion system protein [Cellvibrio sp. pealriver]|uniref:type VI secretion system protein TssA n=1 Tax=Cellvibrio sp. pealriver TaxID=1622269 RepID=UPI00066FCDCA|nr:type VI secretion system ImpA family N-terminal domain-containing protein [Cellvibrio sp. pealriver]